MPTIDPHAADATGTDVPTRFLPRPGGRIAYDVRGEGPLVVCVPGMGDVRSVHRFLVPALVETGFRVATMDLRGHGDSDATFDAYDDPAAGSDVLALVEHLGETRAALIGNSMGAAAAAWAAAERPDVVEALVLVGPFVRDVPISLANRVALRVGMLRPWGPRVWSAYYAKLYPGRPPADLAEHRARILAALRPAARWGAFRATLRTSHAPVDARLGEVRARTLVVMGERDPDFPDAAVEARVVSDRLAGNVLMVAGAGHYPHAEYPEIVTPAVGGVLRPDARA